MTGTRLLTGFAACLLITVAASPAHSLLQLEFDEDIFTAPVGTPFVKIGATLHLDGQHYLYGGNSHGTSTAVWADTDFTLGPDPGETDPNAQTAKFRAQIGDLPGLVPPDGDYPLSIPFVWGYWQMDNWVFPEAYGYPGYISASGTFESSSIIDTYRVEFYNTNDPGNTADNPLMPDSAGSGGFDFGIPLGQTGLGRDFPVFIDPVAAIGYRYEVGPGQPRFEIVYIPSALPLGDADFELNVAGGTYPLTAGVPFNLTQIVPDGVGLFTITGIDPAEGLDPDDPLAFPTGLTFVGDGDVADVTMQVIPEPGTLVLLSIAGMFLIDDRRSRR